MISRISISRISLAVALALACVLDATALFAFQNQDRGEQRRGQEFRQQQQQGQRGQRGGRRGGGRTDDNALIVGEFAPDFQLASPEGENETRLSSFRGEKPVVLYFGSYT